MSTANRVVSAFVSKRRFEVYPDPDTSHVSGEYGTLTEALKKHKATPNAEIIQNGTTMAEAKGHRWEPTYSGKKVLDSEAG